MIRSSRSEETFPTDLGARIAPTGPAEGSEHLQHQNFCRIRFQRRRTLSPRDRLSSPIPLGVDRGVHRIERDGFPSSPTRPVRRDRTASAREPLWAPNPNPPSRRQLRRNPAPAPRPPHLPRRRRGRPESAPPSDRETRRNVQKLPHRRVRRVPPIAPTPTRRGATHRGARPRGAPRRFAARVDPAQRTPR